jgi:hypothetical protein
MAIPGIQEIQALATKYSKPQLQKMAQMGLVDPTKAVMAGMMIDRIQQQNMQPPQQTVAEEVMGAPPPPPMAGGAPEGAPLPGGIAGLPSNLPPQMAGGGIVAFADGGDTEGYAGGGAVGYADRGLVDVRNDPMMKVDPRVQAQRDVTRYQILAEELRQAQARLDAGDMRAKADVEALQREMRSVKPRAAADISLPGISEARAATPAPVAPAPAAPRSTKTSSLPDEPVYTPEGVLLSGEAPTEAAVRKAPPGQPYEPSLIRDILEGRPNVQIAPPRKEEKKAEPAPAPLAPETKLAEKEAAKVEKAEMGPPKPDMVAALRNIGIEEPEKLTAEQALAEQDRIYTQLGVNKDLFSQIRQDYEARRGKFADRADKAAGHALMMFGAGLMGARKGEAFATASKSAQQSLMMYMSSMDKLAEQDDKMDQSLRELTVAEDQYKRTRADSALARMQKNQEKIDAIRLEKAKLEMTAQSEAAKYVLKEMEIQNPAQLTTIKALAYESGKSPMEVFMMAQGISKTGGLTLNQALEAVQRNTQFMGKSPLEQKQEAERLVGTSGGGGATYNYVPGKGLVPTQ